MTRSSTAKLATAEAAVVETTTRSEVGAGVVLTESVGHVRTGVTVGLSIGCVFSRSEGAGTVAATHVVLGTTIALRERRRRVSFRSKGSWVVFGAHMGEATFSPVLALSGREEQARRTSGSVERRLAESTATISVVGLEVRTSLGLACPVKVGSRLAVDGALGETVGLRSLRDDGRS